MRVYTSKTELNAFINTENRSNFSLGFVPTMGALHEGHLSLVKAALAENSACSGQHFCEPNSI